MRSAAEANITNRPLTRTRVAGGILAALTVVFVVWAWFSDVDLFGQVDDRLIGDIAVGVVFPVAALAARGELVQRWLVAAVGIAWLAGSVWGGAVGLHQGALILMLVAYPAGRLHPWPIWFAVPVAVAVAVLTPGPLVTGLLLGAEAIGLAVLAASDRWTPRIYPVVAASALSLTLLHAAWLSANGKAAEPAVYEAVLACVAIGYAVATRSAPSPTVLLSDQIVGGNDADELGALQRLLADVLHDPDLHLTEGPGRGRPIRSGGQVVASIGTSSPLIADPRVAAAVDESVRLLVDHRRLQSLDRTRITELDAARRRLIEAGDAERRAAAIELARHVGGPVAAATRQLANLRIDDPDARVLLTTSARLLRDVTVEIDVIVSGVPTETLGEGRLVTALHDLATLSPIPVRMTAVGDPAGSATMETALFYICREALANAAKHSHAQRIDIQLTGNERLTLEVADDGTGGADPDGFGLRGLADRASAVGATLTVESPAGGTTIRVVAPIDGSDTRSGFNV